MRRRLVVANWKMNKTTAEVGPYVSRLSEILRPREVEVVVAPPFTSLYPAAHCLAGTPFGLAAQNVFWEEKGPYTGEISAPMLSDLGCQYVIIGHSERRRWFGEDDLVVNNKVLAALRHDLRPILCLGETLQEREAGVTESIVTRQLLEGLKGTSHGQLSTAAIAYEPVWAIGTGRAATGAQAIEVHSLLRRTVATHWNDRAAQSIRILYGGSVTADNAAQFLALADVDGVLVGGACLDPDGFAKIARSAEDIVVRDT